MCGEKKLFVEMEEDVHDNIKFDDSSEVPIKEKEKSCLNRRVVNKNTSQMCTMDPS